VNLVRKEDVTVLHAHMMSSAFVGYIASRLTGLPLVTTVHNSFDPHSILMRLGDKVVAVSESERMALLGKGYPKNKVTAVVNAPDRSPRMEFGQHDPEPEIEGPCIVAANALHRRKGVFDLIEACKQVMPSFPEWKLYIAGEGPDREVLEQKVKEEGLGDRVTFLGFLKNPRPLMNKADIFVLASYADPCSLAVGEARCAGSAIIATHVGGTPEMLEFGKAGRLIAPGRPDQLAAALRGLMEDDEARRHLQQAALEGSEKFDVRCLVPAYADVYMQAKLQRRAGGQALQTSTLSDTPAA
jgi:glycosyltransferase involved in cell wall biosynthesis